MDVREFDRFADEYAEMHARNIRVSGEDPAFFAEYKVKDMAAALTGRHFPSRVLDFGGGIGASVPYLREHFPNVEITCLDVSRRSLAIAAERYPGQAKFELFDGSHIPFEDGHFDASIAACVFHHIDHVEHIGLLAELRRVLGAGGSMFVFEHNPMNPLTVRAVSTCEFDQNAHLIRAGEMVERLRSAGFADVGVCYRVFFPRFLSAFRPLERWLARLPLGAQYYVHGRASE